jgi:hypothetical protein
MALAIEPTPVLEGEAAEQLLAELEVRLEALAVGRRVVRHPGVELHPAVSKPGAGDRIAATWEAGGGSLFTVGGTQPWKYRVNYRDEAAVGAGYSHF